MIELFDLVSMGKKNMQKFNYEMMQFVLRFSFVSIGLGEFELAIFCVFTSNVCESVRKKSLTLAEWSDLAELVIQDQSRHIPTI